MMLNNQDVAKYLLRELHRRVGCTPELISCEFIPCEDLVSCMFYGDLATGETVPIVFNTPKGFSPVWVAEMLLCGNAPTVH